MIYADQPTIFKNAIVVGLSSAEDGNMKFGRNDENEICHNRHNFLSQVGIDPLEATLVQVSYEDTLDFTRYSVLDEDRQGEGMLEPLSDLHADGLIVTRPNHALFLPLADCIGAVIYDPETSILMVSHLGRHSLEMDGGAKSIAYMVQEFGSEPADLLIWLSPSVGEESYPVTAFDGKSLQTVALEQLISAGVIRENIEASRIDTAENDNYFSHSEYLAGTQMADERFAIVAMMG